MSRIADRDRIPIFQKLMFAAGVNMDYVATGLMTSVLWMPYFNIGLGMSPAMLGFVLMILRAWDAMTNPIIGNLSDNARTRWGRRRPFMVVGAVLCAAMYPLLWRMPEGLGETGNAVYLTLTGMVFFTCYALWSMPYYGMQLELTPNYDERTRLAAWLTFFGKLSLLGGGWLLAVVTGSRFTNAATGQPDIVAGVKSCSWLIAAGILFFGLLPPLFVKERYYESGVVGKGRDPFWRSIRESARCRPLWMLIGASFFIILGYASVASLGQYLNIYYVNHGHLAESSVITGWKTSIVVATGLVCIPLWTWIGEKFDKKSVVAVMVGASAFGHMLNLYMLTPAHPYWQLIPGVFESGAIAAVWMFLPSMKADTADYDEQYTLRRREGGLNAFYSWFTKAANTCAMGLSGVVIELAGFAVTRTEQPPEVLSRMMGFYLVMPLIFWAVALVFVYFYPLNRARMTTIRQLLETRRGTI